MVYNEIISKLSRLSIKAIQIKYYELYIYTYIYVPSFIICIKDTDKEGTPYHQQPRGFNELLIME